MIANGNFLAEFLDQAQRAHASAIANRQLHSGGSSGAGARAGELAEERARIHFDDLRAETEQRLAHLAEAVAIGVPDLFVDHVAWTRSAFAARGLPDSLLLDNLHALGAELAERLPPDLHELAASYVRAGIDAALRESRAQPAVGTTATGCQRAATAAGDPDARDASAALRNAYYGAVLAGDGERAKAVLRDAAREGGGDGTAFDRIIDEVLVPTQHELGVGWQVGTSSIADEHFGTLLATELLTEFRLQRRRPQPIGRRLLATSVTGDFHQLGLQVVVDRFWSAGWQVDCLGASTPMLEFIARAVRFRPDVIAISASLSTSLRATARSVEGLRLEPSLHGVPILVGGGAFARIAELWRKVGADLSADSAADALARVERWFASRTDQGLTNR